ncbi:MAG: FkbM family methyltransferase [Mucilaginibacter polytrichastri]|nr:FkbM family methyltransferase [Mucilaginibacter polytrichastri]
MRSFIKKNFSRESKGKLLHLLVYPALLYYKWVKNMPIYLRRGSSDIRVFYHTLIEKEFANPCNIEDPAVIIDAGANIGLTALMFARKYPDAKIIAIEPESSNFGMLIRNTRNHENVTCIKKGLWSSDANLKIENPESEHWGFITTEVPDDESYDLSGISVDTLLKRYAITDIDLFKIDIEGSEQEVFSKNPETWLPKTKWIVIELHAVRQCEKVVTETLGRYNFELVHVNGENRYYANRTLVPA